MTGEDVRLGIRPASGKNPALTKASLKTVAVICGPADAGGVAATEGAVTLPPRLAEGGGGAATEGVQLREELRVGTDGAAKVPREVTEEDRCWLRP